MKIRYILLLLIIFFTSNFYAKERNENLGNVFSYVPTSGDDFVYHAVTSGETVYSLARRYGTTVDDINRLNPESVNGIKSGQTLRIPNPQRLVENKSVQHRPTEDAGYFNYTVQKGETIYRIARENDVSIETLYALNPELNKSGLKKGMVIKIPQTKITPQTLFTEQSITALSANQTTDVEHTVVLGETVYSLSKKYDITIEELYKANPSIEKRGLRSGMRVLIPNNSSSRVENVASANSIGLQTDKVMRIAILFPFSEGAGSVQKEKLMEYYEGFLLALKDMKAAGVDVEVYTFNTGNEKDTKRLEGILETIELRSANLIIGGTTEKQINLISKFSRRIGAHYIIPFSTGGTSQIASENPNTFQMTVSNRTIYPQIAKAFARKFRNDNIIIFTEPGSDKNKSEFTNELKNTLAEQGIAFKTLKSTSNMLDDLNRSIVTNKNNVIVPTSSSEVTLKRITGVLNSIHEKPITLFGYPDWQVYNSLIGAMSKYNTYIYSSFFLSEVNHETQRITHEYKKWYNKIIPYQFPKFAFLGYDTALYFISAYKKYGASFDVAVPTFTAPTLQSSIHFERNELDSGYINTGFYFVHFRQDSSVEKFEYK